MSDVAKAIQVLKSRSEFVAEINIDAKMAYILAIKALEKHMPRKVINVTSEYDGDYGSCASCKNIICDFTSPALCKHCGQKLNWR